MKSCLFGMFQWDIQPHSTSEANNRGLYNAKAVEDVAASVASVQRCQKNDGKSPFFHGKIHYKIGYFNNSYMLQITM